MGSAFEIAFSAAFGSASEPSENSFLLEGGAELLLENGHILELEGNE